MSDISQGEGWWQASDLKWYPPEQHPGQQGPAVVEPPVTEAIAEPPPALPPSIISAPPVAPATTSPPPTAGPPASNAKWVAVAVAAAAVVAIAAFFLLGRDDGTKKVVAASSSSNTASASSNSSSSASSSSSQLTDAELQDRMLTAQEIGPSFKDGTFSVDSTTPTPCGEQNLNLQVPPVSDLGSQASDAATKAFFREELSVYDDDATAARAFDLGKQGLGCSQGTTSTGARFTFSAPRNVSSDLGVPSIVIDYEVGTISGQLIAVQEGTHILSFQFEAPTNVDRATLPNALTITKQGLAKLDR